MQVCPELHRKLTVYLKSVLEIHIATEKELFFGDFKCTKGLQNKGGRFLKKFLEYRAFYLERKSQLKCYKALYLFAILKILNIFKISNYQ